MVTFFVAAAILVFGYFVYAKIVENIFVVDPKAVTPVHTKADGVDYVPLSDRKAMLIQFISIAGTGPIFGAILGAMWGPASFFWIVLGCVFAGATHDYASGMLSLRQDGATLSEMVGKYLGPVVQMLCRIVMIALLVMVAAVFTMSPADILTTISPDGIGRWFWIAIIIVYFGIATVIPINKLIARLYPVFGAGMILLGIGMTVALFTTGAINQIPEFQFNNPHPAGRVIFPYLFITIACGAISGFHATQSPLMARCMNSETGGRDVFYRAMIFEGFLALVWAAVAMTFFWNPATGEGLTGLAAAGPPAVVVSTISFAFFGTIGGIIAIICVGIFPISTGDTALRVARLTIAEVLKIDQGPIFNRIKVSAPLFAIVVVLLFIDFGILWRYFAWMNQTLAMFTLWAGAVYLAQRKLNHWICTLPAIFMTFLTQTYILVATEGLQLDHSIGIPIGAAFTLGCTVVFVKKCLMTGKSVA
ncbi:MAG: carbon starvation protein A [Defluviitaleaceae bacterium]|nr:carbon starvation protein A [Defluviitaleaceae bacterium]